MVSCGDDTLYELKLKATRELLKSLVICLIHMENELTRHTITAGEARPVYLTHYWSEYKKKQIMKR